MLFNIWNPQEIARLHFDVPTMVKFIREDETEILTGIAYNHEIICLCCGGVSPLDEVIAISYNPEVWVDCSRGLQEKLDKALREST